jgi:hypothetical protein
MALQPFPKGPTTLHSTSTTPSPRSPARSTRPAKPAPTIPQSPDVTAGQLVALGARTHRHAKPRGTHAIQVSYEVKAAAPNESFICQQSTAVSANTVQNWTAFGGMVNFGTSEIAASSVLPIAGTLHRFDLLTSATICDRLLGLQHLQKRLGVSPRHRRH